MTHPEYLVRYGGAGDLGRFRCATPLDLTRGRSVVVRTPRGEEVGRVVRRAAEGHARHLPNTSVGALLRAATEEDERRQHRLADRAAAVLNRAGRLVEELSLPVTLLDAEVLGDQGVLHLVQWQACDVRDLVRALSREFELTVALADLAAPQESHEDHGCGSCGEGGCGSCGSGGGCGSCGEGDRDRFAALRQQMERRTPLL